MRRYMYVAAVLCFFACAEPLATKAPGGAPSGAGGGGGTGAGGDAGGGGSGGSGTGGDAGGDAGGGGSAAGGAGGAGLPADWVCDPTWYGDADCDCGCGALDVDCHGLGCSGPGCIAQGCEFCFDGGEQTSCYRFCEPCAVDADCIVGVCVPDPDGPAAGFCAAPCDACNDNTYCGADGNCGTAFWYAGCSESASEVVGYDFCGNRIATEPCTATQACWTDDAGERGTCVDLLPSGSSATSCDECQGGDCFSYRSAPEHTICTEACGAPDTCPSGMHCDPDNACGIDFSSRCDADRRAYSVYDDFGRTYAGMAGSCGPTEACVDAVDSAGRTQAICWGQGALGATCASSIECASADCRAFAQAPSGPSFCTQACAADADCGGSMRCGREVCVPILSSRCSADGRSVETGDDFGRSFSEFARVCGAGSRCQDGSADGRPAASCVTLVPDGHDCTQDSDCAGGICTSFVDSPQVSFCSSNCGAGAPCGAHLNCNGSQHCVPERRELCQSDGSVGFRGGDVVRADDFGHVYATLEVCGVGRRCAADVSGAWCESVCGRPSGCHGSSGFVECCGPDVYSAGECCQTCNFDGDSSTSCRSAP